MLTPPAPVQPPVAVPDSHRALDFFWTNKSFLWGVGTALIGACATYYSLNYKVEDLGKDQGRTGAEVVLIKAQHQRDNEDTRNQCFTSIKELKADTDKKFERIDSTSSDHARSIAVINTRLDALDKAVQETRDNTRLILERMGDGRSGRGAARR